MPRPCGLPSGGVGVGILQHGVDDGDEWFGAPDAGEDGAVAGENSGNRPPGREVRLRGLEAARRSGTQRQSSDGLSRLRTHPEAQAHPARGGKHPGNGPAPVRQPSVPGRSDLGGRRRTSADMLLLSLLLSAREGAGSTGEGGWTRKNRDFSRFFKVVPAEGLEPPHPSGQQILSLSRLPFRHAGMVVRPKI